MKATPTRIAQRYVKALFEVASRDAALDAVDKDMQMLKQALTDNATLREFLNNPLLTRQAQTDAMKNLLSKVSAHALTQKFIAMLASQRRLDILSLIATLFTKEVAASRGEVSAELISASPLKADEARQIAARLSKAYGKKINLTLTHDASLLGGAVIKIGSQQLDSSLAGKLSRLKIALQAA